jgi:MoxR-like ATPase
MDRNLRVASRPLSVEFIKELVEAIVAELDKVVVGYDDIKRKIVYALLADQHVLLESVPGLAKTLLVETLTQTLIGAHWRRIQFTPDLLPTDITGSEVMVRGDWVFKPGPLLGELQEREGKLYGTTNLLVADEINRTPPKTQSALLAPMQERRVALDGKMVRLPSPFLVVATENPIENEGTYPLPEAQQDRFAIKCVLPYPTFEDEVAIGLNTKLRERDAHTLVQGVTDVETIAAARLFVLNEVYTSEALVRYAAKLIRSTRPQCPDSFNADLTLPNGSRLGDVVRFGMSTRSLNTYLSVCQARAAAEGRDYVLPADIQALAPEVLRHRLILTVDAVIDEVPADEVVKTIVDSVPINDDEELYKRR